jgi:hypothetical protein
MNGFFKTDSTPLEEPNIEKRCCVTNLSINQLTLFKGILRFEGRGGYVVPRPAEQKGPDAVVFAKDVGMLYFNQLTGHRSGRSVATPA